MCREASYFVESPEQHHRSSMVPGAKGRRPYVRLRHRVRGRPRAVSNRPLRSLRSGPDLPVLCTPMRPHRPTEACDVCLMPGVRPSVFQPHVGRHALRRSHCTSARVRPCQSCPAIVPLQKLLGSRLRCGGPTLAHQARLSSRTSEGGRLQSLVRRLRPWMWTRSTRASPQPQRLRK